ncbi:MAG: phenylacetate--CoA ligase family protein [Eubacterium sp.]|nr:phenylacetate--CoA ligase family protein [Eubacterium sp.]
MEKIQPGELVRRTAFNALDSMHGKTLQKLIEVNRYEIVNGVTPAYIGRRLDHIMDYARDNCPFYRELDLPEHAKLSDFPVQCKKDFIAHYDTVLSDEFRSQKDKLFKLSTSGSTGTPFTVLADGKKMNHVNANFLSVMGLNGYRLGMKRAELRAWIPGKNMYTKAHCFKNNLLMVDISVMSDEALSRICHQIRDERVQVLVLYSSALTALVTYMDEHNVDPVDWDVEMIFTMGEACPKKTRDKADLLFGCCPVLSYGNNENGFVAVSLNGSEDYTIDLYHYYVEILKMDSDEPAEPGEIGRIVVTDYYNKAFPMIRYDTGDTGLAVIETDESGRVHGRFTHIYGRRGSLLYTTKGEPLSIHVFMNILFHFEGILQQARCVQTGEKEYTLILNPVKAAMPVDEEKIKETYKGYLGQDADITIEYVDRIPIQQSGKTMVCEQKCEKYL